MKTCFLVGTVLQLQSLEKYAALKELLHHNPIWTDYVKDMGQLEKAVFEREKVLCTGIGHGVAIAHGKTRAVDQIIIVLGISQEGVHYHSPDGEPVKFLFMIANPPDKDCEYLSVISCLARLFNDPCFKNEILGTDSLSRIKKRIKRALRHMMRQKSRAA